MVSTMLPMSLSGRMAKLPLSVHKPLVPLFEAITNSIHAIEDAKITDGEIIVHVHRSPDSSQKGFSNELKASQPVVGFTIEDNGIGFTGAHYTAFLTPDTEYKKRRGGKGIGRFYWLKAFQKAHIESTFVDGESKQKRAFDFDLPGNGAHNHSISESLDGKRKTLVTLSNYLPEYVCPKQWDTIARKIIGHFLTYFTMETFPSVFLQDDTEGINRNLNEYFRSQMMLHSESADFNVGADRFTVEHFCILTGAHNPEHTLHFCAIRRSVVEKDLSALLPDLHGPLIDPATSKRFVYAGYISGEKLESTVSDNRCSFDLPHEDDILFRNSEELTWNGIIRATVTNADKFLSSHLAPSRDKKLARIKAIVQQKPQYRFLLKQRLQWINEIRSQSTTEELELELYKLKKRFEIELQGEARKLQSSLVGLPIQKRKERLSRYMTDMNQLGVGKLAEYVVHRRAVLDFLSECMKVEPDGTYPNEDVIHETIFPRKVDSDDVADVNETNLWIVDERLAFHVYLASDVEWKKTGVKVDKESENERTDLLVLMPFDTPPRLRRFQSISPKRASILVDDDC